MKKTNAFRIWELVADKGYSYEKTILDIIPTSNYSSSDLELEKKIKIEKDVEKIHKLPLTTEDIVPLYSPYSTKEMTFDELNYQVKTNKKVVVFFQQKEEKYSKLNLFGKLLDEDVSILEVLKLFDIKNYLEFYTLHKVGEQNEIKINLNQNLTSGFYKIFGPIVSIYRNRGNLPINIKHTFSPINTFITNKGTAKFIPNLKQKKMKSRNHRIPKVNSLGLDDLKKRAPIHLCLRENWIYFFVEKNERNSLIYVEQRKKKENFLKEKDDICEKIKHAIQKNEILEEKNKNEIEATKEELNTQEKKESENEELNLQEEKFGYISFTSPLTVSEKKEKKLSKKIKNLLIDLNQFVPK